MDAVIGTGPGPVSAPAGLQISGAGFRGLFRFRDSASAASAATERSKPMPKEKADKFLEYVDTEGTKARISLADLQKKKTG